VRRRVERRAGRPPTVPIRPPTRRPSTLAAVLTAVLSSAAAPTIALAARPARATASPRATAPPSRADLLLDVRQQLRPAPATTTAAAPHGGPPRDRVAGARRHLARQLGPRAVLDVDPLTGTVRRLQRLDGALTDPSTAPAATVARGYLRDHAPALGLADADAATLSVAHQTRSPSGLTVVRLHQAVAGVTTFDDDVLVGVDRAGRVLSVAGAPRADLPAELPAPRLSAAAALQALMDATGVRAPVTVTTTGHDAQRTTRFSTGDTAELVLFGARTVHLAWHVTFQATSDTWFDAVVDAATGDVLYRTNLVKRATAMVYDNYPGAAVGGTTTSHSLDPYLSSATTLSGPYVHAFADVNDDDFAGAGEEVAPGTSTGPTTNASRSSGACDTHHLCTWNHTVPSSWQLNQAASVTQAFWYANVFHDHLAADPIGFTPADGAFRGDDRLALNALDGAATGTGGGPDADHLDNASMATPPDGFSPRMEMFLFSHGGPDAGLFRDVNGGDDAAIVFHEYTHGLSGRLITTGAGTPALSSAQAAAMGEAWSDWYAEDLLVREGLVPDAPDTDGNVDLGRYVDAVPHVIRSEALDCAVDSTDAAACPGSAGAGPGGYTFGDLGRVADEQEPHADGEIWGQTLWQLRSALVSALGPADGSDTAERLVTDAMRLSPPEPSFLDERDAILAADVNATGGANATRIWDVFRSRGMGFYAAATGSDDPAVVEDFSPPPAAGAPRGAIAGTVTDAGSGLPVAGAATSVAGLASAVPGATHLEATTAPDGRYSIGSVPQGTYPKVRLAAAGYDTLVSPVTVAGGQTTTFDGHLVRDWAARSGGATIAATTDDAGAPYGCGGAALIDQDAGLGWSAVNTTPDAPPSTVVQLPAAITVTAFGIDPSNTCGDDAGASTSGYRLETSADGQTWRLAAQGTLDASARGHLNRIAPSGGADGVRYVRLTLLSPLNPGADYVDATELEVYGAPPNAPPSGSLTATPTPVPLGRAVTLDASSFRDPDSAITGYDWDLDGDGRVDRTTTAPTTDFAYGRTGTLTPQVTVHDFRGGTGEASTSVTVMPSSSPVRRKAKPRLSIPRTASRARIRVRVTCRDACRLSGTVTLDRRSQRRARLRSRTVVRLRSRKIHGTRIVTLTLPRTRRAQLRRHRIRRVTAGVHLKAIVPAGGPRTTAARTVRLRL
jgi:extracellular elastinolytic metalloproteinase